MRLRMALYASSVSPRAVGFGDLLGVLTLDNFLENLAFANDGRLIRDEQQRDAEPIRVKLDNHLRRVGVELIIPVVALPL